MLKILGLIVVMLVMVLGFRGPNTLALPEWKTYYNPDLKFSIDYPSQSGPVNAPINITETTNRVQFDSYEFVLAITVQPNSALGLQEEAVFLQQYLLEKNPQDELVQSVKTVVYNGQVGYSFMRYDSSTNLYSVMMFFNSPSDINKHYKLNFVGYGTVGGVGPLQAIDEFMNTIKFFD